MERFTFFHIICVFSLFICHMCVHAREIVYVHASMCMFTLLHACVCIGGGMLSNIVCMCFDVHAHGTHDIVPFLGVPCMYVYTFTHSLYMRECMYMCLFTCITCVCVCALCTCVVVSMQVQERR